MVGRRDRRADGPLVAPGARGVPHCPGRSQRDASGTRRLMMVGGKRLTAMPGRRSRSALELRGARISVPGHSVPDQFGSRGVPVQSFPADRRDGVLLRTKVGLCRWERPGSNIRNAPLQLMRDCSHRMFDNIPEAVEHHATSAYGGWNQRRRPRSKLVSPFIVEAVAIAKSRFCAAPFPLRSRTRSPLGRNG